ncbi:MAG: hypothetical protein AAB974_01800 [Patescibacteria group bacterium]
MFTNKAAVLGLTMLFLTGVGCSNQGGGATLPETRTIEESLRQERMLTYRQECRNEWSEKVKTVDNLVQGSPDITKEQAQNIARNAGLVDESGYVIDEDIWLKGCIDKKAAIFE